MIIEPDTGACFGAEYRTPEEEIPRRMLRSLRKQHGGARTAVRRKRPPTSCEHCPAVVNCYLVRLLCIVEMTRVKLCAGSKCGTFPFKQQLPAQNSCRAKRCDTSQLVKAKPAAGEPRKDSGGDNKKPVEKEARKLCFRDVRTDCATSLWSLSEEHR